MAALAFSLNTNAPALVGLQTLTDTANDLAETQDRISTGKKVKGAEDNPATFSISQNIRADDAGLRGVKDSLDRATSTLDVALDAAETVSDLLIEARELSTAGSDQGLDSQSRQALEQDYQAILAQIDGVVQQAEFNGSNLVGSSPDQIAAVAAEDGTMTIDVAGRDLSTAGLNLNQNTFNTAGEALTSLTEVNNAISTVETALSEFGAGAERLDLQTEFTNKLSDTFNVGIGNLVDANMAQESAELTALQTKEQLGTQALAIANQTPQTLLQLFQ